MRRPGSIVHIRKIMRKAIYSLKWKFGQPADLYREVQGDYDPETGLRTLLKSKIHVDRMIVFPGLIQRDFFFGISVLRANSKFVTGGDVELDDRQFIIDANDLPKNYIILDDDYIIKDHEKWSFKSVDNLDEHTGYFINARRIVNEVPNEILDGKVKQKEVLTSEFSVGS